MQFEAHCGFELSLKGEIFIVRLFHKWNLEGAKAFSSKYETIVKQHNLKEYGVLSDLRQFEGGGLPMQLTILKRSLTRLKDTVRWLVP